MLLKDLARAAGEKPEVVRYYARIGLVRPVTREPNGYRRFESREVERIGFIRDAQACGLRLTDIRDMLDRQRAGTSQCCARLRQSVRARLADIRREITALEEMARCMERLVAGWDQSGCGRDESAQCPVIRNGVPATHQSRDRGACGAAWK